MQAPASPEPNSILLVSEPGVDGVFHYVRDLANGLHERGWTVHLAYSSVRDCPALYEFVDRVRQRGGRTLDLRVGNFPGPADAPALWRLRALAWTVRPTIIHAHSSKAGVLARALPLLGVRAHYFYTPHAYYQMYGPAGAKKRVFALVERVFGRVGQTLNTSHAEEQYAREVLGIPEAQLCVALTGVDCERFRPPVSAAAQGEARMRFGLPAGVPLLGTVARLSDQKDPRTLYRALLTAMAQATDLHFAHLGKGDLSGEIDVLLAAAPADVRVRIHRLSGSTDTPSFYQGLDAFALPSRYEGFALSALEALATGLPLILTDCPGNDDLKNFGLDALRWCTVGEAADLSATILEWHAAGPRANNHRETALARLNGRDTLEKVLCCYAKQIASGPSG